MGKEIRSVEHHTNPYQSQNSGGDLGGKKEKLCEMRCFRMSSERAFRAVLNVRALVLHYSPSQCFLQLIGIPSEFVIFPNMQDSTIGSCVPRAKGTWIPTLFSINYTVLKMYRYVRLIFPSFFSRIMSFLCICVKVHLCLHKASESTETSYFLLTSQYY